MLRMTWRARGVCYTGAPLPAGSSWCLRCKGSSAYGVPLIVELKFNIAQLGASNARHVCPFKSGFDLVFQRALYGLVGPLDVNQPRARGVEGREERQEA